MIKLFLIFTKTFGQLFWAARGVLLSLVLVLILCAFLISLVEPIGFGDAVYLSFITALTIGYGDIVPITPLGKILCIAVGFTGMVFLGLVVAVGNSAMQTVSSKKKDA